MTLLAFVRIGLSVLSGRADRWGAGAVEFALAPALVPAAVAWDAAAGRDLRSFSSFFEYSSWDLPISLHMASRYCRASMLSGCSS